MKLKRFTFVVLIQFFTILTIWAQPKRARDYGITFGPMMTGNNNSITDVKGVLVGQVTLIEREDIRTGVTAVLPHSGNIFQQKVPAAIYIANGFGKLTGYSQIEELGNIETPIVLVNTLSVPTAADALIDYTLQFDENKSVRSVNPVVGETNDGSLNNIQIRYLQKEHVLNAIKSARSGPVLEGNVGAGTGTICFGYKGGIGTSSRVLSKEEGSYTIGVLVQTNYGGNLTIAGIPVGQELQKKRVESLGDGSVMIIVATDAPIKARNLKRMAKRALFGIARTGGNCSNGSGEYVIAFSVAENLRLKNNPDGDFFETGNELQNNRMTSLFEAVADATEEAVINSLIAAKMMIGRDNMKINVLPVEDVVEILKLHRVIKDN